MNLDSLALHRALGDRDYLEIAQRAALQGESQSYAVGCIIVDSTGRILSHGFRCESGHEVEGQSTLIHAEEMALGNLDELGVSAQGSTIYTTLEPCSSRRHGLISCSTKIIEHGVRRVVFGHLDHNHNGAGLICEGADLLRIAGIQVDYLDCLKDTCEPSQLAQMRFRRGAET